MTTPNLPPWARRHAGAARSVPPSDSVPRGTGETAARPAGAAPPRGLAGILNLALSTSLDGAAERAWRAATREQLQEVAERMAASDPQKALAVSAILAWAVAGQEVELPVIRPGDLPWVFLATVPELHMLGAEVARLSPQAARALWVGLGEALEAQDEAFRATGPRTA